MRCQKQPLRCLDFRSELHQTSFLDIWAIIIYFPEDPFKTSLPSLSSSSDIITLLRITSTNIIGKIKQMLKPFQSSVLAVRFTPVPLSEEEKRKGLQEAFYLLLEDEAGQAAARRWQWELMDGGEAQGKTLSTPDRSQWGFSILRHYFSVTLDSWKSYSQACSAEPTVDNFVQAATGRLEVWIIGYWQRSVSLD